MNENKAVPNIRFNGFEDVWESMKFKNILNYERPDKYIVKSDNYSNNGIPVLTANKSFILGYTIESSFYEKPLPIIIFDDFTLDCKLVKFPFKIKSSAIKILSSNNFSDIWFDFYLLKATSFIKEGHARHYISIVQNKKINVPSEQEQQKIGNLFAKLDKLLDLQQQKIDKLELLKKTLLQKLFPRHEAKIPELRYREFEVNWITYSFSSLLIKNSSKNKNLEIENIESISNKNGFTKQSEQFDGYRVASLDLSNYYVIKGNQFAYNPSRINVGSIAYKRKGEEDSIISPLYVSFSTKNNINDTFLWYWFKTSSFKKQRIQFSEGGVRDTLPFENLKKMQIKLPRLKEQQKIGNLLSKVDQLIELENKKLENLQQFKKCLLQNMFVE